MSSCAAIQRETRQQILLNKTNNFLKEARGSPKTSLSLSPSPGRRKLLPLWPIRKKKRNQWLVGLSSRLYFTYTYRTITGEVGKPLDLYSSSLSGLFAHKNAEKHRGGNERKHLSYIIKKNFDMDHLEEIQIHVRLTRSPPHLQRKI
eukprot:gene824-462_t